MARKVSLHALADPNSCCVAKRTFCSSATLSNRNFYFRMRSQCSASRGSSVGVKVGGWVLRKSWYKEGPSGMQAPPPFPSLPHGLHGRSQRQLVPLSPWHGLTLGEQPTALPSSQRESLAVVVAVAEKDEEPEVEPPDPLAAMLNGPATLALALAKTVSCPRTGAPASRS